MTLALLGGKAVDVAPRGGTLPRAAVVVRACARCGRLQQQALADEGTRAVCMVCGWINPQPLEARR